MTKFSEFLNKKLLEYQFREGRKIKYQDFAVWLGVSPTTFSNWINGGYLPNMENTVLIANKLGLEVYDALERDRPVPSLPMEKMPIYLQRQLSKFVSTVSYALKDIDPDSSEAEPIIKPLVEKLIQDLKELS